MFTQNKLAISMLATSLYACSYNGSVDLPGLYRIDVQQGNVLEQSMLDGLKAGMEKNQVEFILGTPAFIDSFHTDQWVYLFTFAEDNKNRKQRHIRLHFIDNKLAYIDGDVVATTRDATERIRLSRTVEVPPDRQRKQGIFSRMINSIPFIGKEKKTLPEPDDTKNELTSTKEFQFSK